MPHLFQLDPFTDRRWQELLQGHPLATVFHTICWLRTLQQTYGYQPVVVTTAPSGSELSAAIVFCKSVSWARRHKWVSLPFSDHCKPLGDRGDIVSLIHTLADGLGDGAYVELRGMGPGDRLPRRFSIAKRFVLHTLDLRPKLDSIFNRFHKNCIQRKIQRAERERIAYREGGAELVDEFFRLYVMTRRRHGVPPAPKKWFRNLLENFGTAAKLRLAYHRNQPVAGMLTLAHGGSLVYKYGCSDASKNRLGGMPLLFWKAIQDAKQASITTFDLGRSDLDAAGLIAFKERLGATAAVVEYVSNGHRSIVDLGLAQRVAAATFRRLPDPLLIGAGRLLYPRIS